MRKKNRSINNKYEYECISYSKYATNTNIFIFKLTSRQLMLLYFFIIFFYFTTHNNITIYIIELYKKHKHTNTQNTKQIAHIHTHTNTNQANHNHTEKYYICFFWEQGVCLLVLHSDCCD